MKTNDGKYGILNVPGELIDVPIQHIDSYKIANYKFSQEFKNYAFSYSGGKFNFNSYTLYGFLHDLYQQLFKEVQFPWQAAKYDKKINRLVFMYFIYFYNKYSNYNELLNNGLRLLNGEKLELVGKLRNSNQQVVVSNDKKYSREHPLHDEEKMLREFLRVCSRFINPSDESRRYVATLKESLSNFATINTSTYIKTNYESNKEEIPYLQKYLKYKQKYASLKNNMY
jgi:hypothetical protein